MRLYHSSLNNLKLHIHVKHGSIMQKSTDKRQENTINIVQYHIIFFIATTDRDYDTLQLKYNNIGLDLPDKINVVLFVRIRQVTKEIYTTSAFVNNQNLPIFL